MTIRTALSCAALLTLLPGCTRASPAPVHSRGEAVLRNAQGEGVGMAAFAEDAQGQVHIHVNVNGLTPGPHGLHLHETGVCDGTTETPFSSAGGHFDRTGSLHGPLNPAGHHSGDLPNLVVDEAGEGRLSVTVERFALADLFDADGAALVVHQKEDDLRTDTGPLGPGNSGPRIACGVVTG